jgi:hypothetical protein
VLTAFDKVKKPAKAAISISAAVKALKHHGIYAGQISHQINAQKLPTASIAFDCGKGNLAKSYANMIEFVQAWTV